MNSKKNDKILLESAKKGVTAYLATLLDPRNGQEMVASGLMTSLQFRELEDGIALSLILEPGETPLPKGFVQDLESNLAQLPGMIRASVVVTAHAGPNEQEARIAQGHANPLGVSGARPVGVQSPGAEKIILPGVKSILAVVSGKGGVGKSTIAANLAVAMAQNGLKVGLMDADIYGPSLPTIFGLHKKAAMEAGKIIPEEKYGVRAMSIGLLLEEGKALAWRGPMVMGAVRQLLTEVAWGELDILIIDTPPGTGDAHLTLLQKLTLSAAIIVTTPQEMALADVRRGAALFNKMKAPLLGVVENMAYFELPDGSRQKIFATGGAEKAAHALNLSVLQQIPIYPELGQASDDGEPVAVRDKNHPAAQAFSALAGIVVEKLGL